MPTYSVKWEIEIDAESPREAAEEARAIQKDPESEATIFEVADLSQDNIGIHMEYEYIDLMKEDEDDG